MSNVNDDLEHFFPEYSSDGRAPAWEDRKAELRVGSRVDGVVIARYPFGAFVDIGIGFPALIMVPDIEGMTPENYQSDAWCPVKSTLSAEVVLFNDRDHVVRIAQGTPHELRENG